MTPIAPLMTDFLREHMPIAQGYSPHTCETYAHAFRLLFLFASERLRMRPSQLPRAPRSAVGARIPGPSGGTTRQWCRDP
jgi:hypothetical protein